MGWMVFPGCLKKQSDTLMSRLETAFILGEDLLTNEARD